MARRFQWLKGDKQGKIEEYKDSIQEDDFAYLLFKSGNRVGIDLIGDYITEITEEGEPFIDSSLFIPHTILNSNKNIPKETKVKETNKTSKMGEYSVENLIEAQLNKSTKYVKIYIDIPVLNKAFFDVLSESYPNVAEDLTKIITNKYINQENIKKSLKEKIEAYYKNNLKLQKSNIININTEKL